MPLNYRVYDYKFFNEQTNGSDFSLNPTDFTENLVGNVGTKIKVEFLVYFEWFTDASNGQDTLYSEPALNQISRQIGNFHDDGWKVGHVFEWRNNFNTGSESAIPFYAEITYISPNGRTLEYASSLGTAPVSGSYTDVGLRAYASASDEFGSHMFGLIYNYGIIENDENAGNYNNYATEEEQVYYFSGIGAFDGGNRITSAIQGENLGIVKGWQTGSIECNYQNNTIYRQQFKVSHEFILPYYREDELQNLINNQPFDSLEGTKTWKYVPRFRFREAISNPNDEIDFAFDENLGSVGFFDENYNGFNNEYSIVSVSYQDFASGDTVTGLQIFADTRVNITVAKASGEFATDQIYLLTHSYLPPDTEIKGQPTDWQANTLYDSLRCVTGIANNGANEISFSSAEIIDGNLVIQMIVGYALEDRLKLSSIKRFALAVQVGDDMLQTKDDNRANLLVDVGQYVYGGDVSELINQTSWGILEWGDELGVTEFKSDLFCWNEDDTIHQVGFTIDLSKNAVINNAAACLVARKDDGAFFIIDQVQIDISNSITDSNGVQQINTESQRAYSFVDGSQYRILNFTTGSLIGEQQAYQVQFAQKIQWKEWVRNVNADTVFYNASEPNDGLNNKSSNYSGLNDYEVRAGLLVGLSGTDQLGEEINGVALLISGILTVNDYDQDKANDPNIWSSAIEMREPDQTVNIGNVYFTDRASQIVSIHTNSGGAVTDLTGIVVLHRYEPENTASDEIVIQSASLTLEGGNVVAKSLLDPSLLNRNQKYKISSRIYG
ncbi:MAG: hypothetical protein HRT61_00915 [Ekhidna sp.]|nr:hypothetical protein [Ekhidna sp.]